jgi:hypothetical protein
MAACKRSYSAASNNLPTALPNKKIVWRHTTTGAQYECKALAPDYFQVIRCVKRPQNGDDPIERGDFVLARFGIRL